MRRRYRLLQVNLAALALLAAAPAGPGARAAAQRPDATERAVRAIADGVLRDATFQVVDATGARYDRPEQAPAGARLHLASPYNDWRYWNGVMGVAMLRLSDVLGDPRYAGFARRNVAYAFDHYGWFEKAYAGEPKWEYPFAQWFIMRELDDYGSMGASVVDVMRLDPQPRYRDYVLRAGDYALSRQGRLPDGTLVRDFPVKWTLWADDLYMSVSLLARLGQLTGDHRWYDDAARQVIGFNRYVFDERAGLMLHNWYSDPAPGGQRGLAFWGRANGWALVAQADLLDRLPADHPQRAELLRLLRRHILGVARYQGGDGLWHQLLDRDDSYLETSSTAMFAYTIAHAVNAGWLEPRYGSIAQRAWAGVLTRIRPDGQVEGVCTGTGVSDNLVDYYHRPAPLNDIHGVATVLLAGAEMLRLERSGR